MPDVVSSLGPAHHPIAVHRHSACEFSSHDTGAVVHDHAVVSFVVAGQMRFWMGHDFELRRGDLLLVPEGTPHYTVDGADAEIIGVALCTHCLLGAWGSVLRDAFAEVRRVGAAARHVADEAQLTVVLEALERELAAGHRSDLMVDGLMSQLAAHIVRAAPSTARDDHGQGAPDTVARALDFIDRHGAAAVSLSDVATAVGRSPAYLTATVKQHTGRTVVEWITHTRMATARQLLRSSDVGVSTIAESVGYASASHFHRTFRREHGATPGEWRRQHRQ